ncbi:hypothetical protein [Methylobacterium sp. ID0610]|uniref:hypothetical protein n=1 Tax=Methylobacterium carpenticola TaxID=3344827 RepID=UPI0036946CDC
MLGYQEPDTQTPPPAPERVRCEAAVSSSESERLERLLAGIVLTRPEDDTICALLLKRNLVVTQLAA